nr:MAG TPA: hypothetical protein [Caudoviricetes sp.]
MACYNMRNTKKEELDSRLPIKKSNSKHHKGYSIIITWHLPFVNPKGVLYER